MISMSSNALFFQVLNGDLQPLFDRLFDLLLGAIAIERIEIFTKYIEGNVAAGNSF